MAKHSRVKIQMLAATVAVSSLIISNYIVNGAEPRRQSPSAATNVTNSRQAKRIETEQEKCGAVDALAVRVNECAKPLMDILGGRLEVWPVNQNETMRLCENFGFSERCIKDTSRKCAKGIQKTIISTIGQSVQRVRKRECSRSKADAILKTTNCIKNHQIVVQNWMTSVTARLTAIEEQQPSPEKRINSICCMVRDIDTEIKSVLVAHCPEEAKFMQRLFRGVVDNTVDIVCRQPKCNDYLKGLKISKEDNFEGLITIILRIVFSLDASENR